MKLCMVITDQSGSPTRPLTGIVQNV